MASESMLPKVHVTMYPFPLMYPSSLVCAPRILAYLQTGFYTEVFLRQHHVHFVAIANSVDSDDQNSNEFAPFLTIIEMAIIFTNIMWVEKTNISKSRCV